MGHCINNPRKKQDTKPYILKKKKKKERHCSLRGRPKMLRALRGRPKIIRALRPPRSSWKTAFFKNHIQNHTHLVFPTHKPTHTLFSPAPGGGCSPAAPAPSSVQQPRPLPSGPAPLRAGGARRGRAALWKEQQFPAVPGQPGQEASPCLTRHKSPCK